MKKFVLLGVVSLFVLAVVAVVNIFENDNKSESPIQVEGTEVATAEEMQGYYRDYNTKLVSIKQFNRILAQQYDPNESPKRLEELKRMIADAEISDKSFDVQYFPRLEKLVHYDKTRAASLISSILEFERNPAKVSELKALLELTK